jgi:YD repeat-containing protein
LGRVTSYTYQSSTSANDFGRLLAATFAVGTAYEATTGFEYDLAGDVTATIDELGRRTEYEFNDLDQLTRMLLPDADGAGTLTSPEINYGPALA